jgi:DNA (cytosine-5)-methyltransferase 1
MNQSLKKNFLEFFAGVGLVRLGLQKNNWNCSWANDICSDKESTYVENFGSSDFLREDIWKVAENPSLLPKAFLATSSFPCTDMSLAGGRKGLTGKQSGTLYAFLKIIEKLSIDRPQVLMLENVKGFLNSNDGQDLISTVQSLNKLNYVVDILEIDAKLFTPQSRPRVFLFAVQESLAAKVMIQKSDHEHQVFSKWDQIYVSNPTIRTPAVYRLIAKNPTLKWGVFDIPNIIPARCLLDTILEAIPEDSTIWWNERRTQKLFDQMSENHQQLLTTNMQNKKWSYGTVYRRVRLGTSRAELRTDGYAGCLRTPKGGSSKQILVKMGFGKFHVRFLTPREYARLQGVSDTFILPNNETSGYFAMGDGVCVPVIDWISKNILNPCYAKYSEEFSTPSKKQIFPPQVNMEKKELVLQSL